MNCLFFFRVTVDFNVNNTVSALDDEDNTEAAEGKQTDDIAAPEVLFNFLYDISFLTHDFVAHDDMCIALAYRQTG